MKYSNPDSRRVPVGMTGIQQACAIKKVNKQIKEANEAMMEGMAIAAALKKK